MKNFNWSINKSLSVAFLLLSSLVVFILTAGIFYINFLHKNFESIFSKIEKFEERQNSIVNFHKNTLETMSVILDYKIKNEMSDINNLMSNLKTDIVFKDNILYEIIDNIKLLYENKKQFLAAKEQVLGTFNDLKSDIYEIIKTGAKILNAISILQNKFIENQNLSKIETEKPFDQKKKERNFLEYFLASKNNILLYEQFVDSLKQLEILLEDAIVSDSKNHMSKLNEKKNDLINLVKIRIENFKNDLQNDIKILEFETNDDLKSNLSLISDKSSLFFQKLNTNENIFKHIKTFEDSKNCLSEQKIKLANSLNDLIDKMSKDAESLKYKINSILNVTKTEYLSDYVIFLICLIIILTFLIALILQFSVIKSVKNVLFAGKRLLENETIAFDSKDEMGVLCNTFNSFIVNSNSLFDAKEKDFAKMKQLFDIIQKYLSELKILSSDYFSKEETMILFGKNLKEEIDSIAKQQNDLFKISREMKESFDMINSFNKKIYESADRTIKEESKANTKAVENNERITSLNEKTNEIVYMIDMITDISNQTNLLALNAKIEASSAGESGEGFAIVANEIKDLANETSKVAKKITQQIKRIKDDVDFCLSYMKDIGNIIISIGLECKKIEDAIHKQSNCINSFENNISLNENVVNYANKSAQHLDLISKKFIITISNININQIAKKINSISQDIDEKAKVIF